MSTIFKKLLPLSIIALASINLYAQTYSKTLENQAKGGDVEAMVSIGEAYLTGNGVKKNPKEAEKWLKKAAENNSAKAYHLLVDAYQSWDLIEKNSSKAFKWAQKGANAGLCDLKVRFADILYKDGQPDKALILAKNALVNDGYLPALVPAAIYSLKCDDFASAYALCAIASQIDDPVIKEQKDVIDAVAMNAMSRMRRIDLPSFDKIKNTTDPDAIYSFTRYNFHSLEDINNGLSRLDPKSPQYAMLKALSLFDSYQDNNQFDAVADLIKKAAQADIPEAVNLMAIMTSPKGGGMDIVQRGEGFYNPKKDDSIFGPNITPEEPTFNIFATFVKKNLNNPSPEYSLWLRKAGNNGTVEGAIINFYSNAYAVENQGHGLFVSFTSKYDAMNAVNSLIPYYKWTIKPKSLIDQNHQLRDFDRNSAPEAPTRVLHYTDGNLVGVYFNELSKMPKIAALAGDKGNIFDYYPASIATMGADISNSYKISQELADAKVDKYIETHPDLLAKYIITSNGRDISDIKSVLRKLNTKVSAPLQEQLSKFAYDVYNMLL